MYRDTLRFLFILTVSEYVQGVQPVDEFCTPAEPRASTMHPVFVQKPSPSHLSGASPLCRGFQGVRWERSGANTLPTGGPGKCLWVRLCGTQQCDKE